MKLRIAKIRLRREDHREVGQLVGAVLESREYSHPDALVGKLAVGDARPQDRVHLGHVRAPQHEGVGMLDVVIAAHRLLDTKGAHEAGNRRRHAVTGIGVEIIGTEASLHQLCGRVAFPDRPLARAEHGKTIWPLGLQRGLDLLFHDIEGLLPRDRRELTILIELTILHAQQRRLQAIRTVHDLGQEVALDAVQAAINWRIRVALSGHNASFLRPDQNTTAGATKTTGRLVPANFVLALRHGCRRCCGQACCRNRRRCCVGLDEIPSIELHASTSSVSTDSSSLY